MNLEINTNGAWRIVLENLTDTDISRARQAAGVLTEIAGANDQRLSFRLTVDGKAVDWTSSRGTVWR